MRLHKKGLEGTAIPETSPCEINQVQNSISENSLSIPGEIVSELAAMKTRYDEIYNQTGLAGFMCGNGLYEGVQLSERAFTATFNEYESADRNDEKYPTELYAMISGVRFFCIR